MIEAHGGEVDHKNSFEDIYSNLINSNEIKLQTSTGKEFIALAEQKMIERFFVSLEMEKNLQELMCVVGVIITIVTGQGLVCTLKL